MTKSCRELARAFFRAIAFGADELRAITPPPLPGRTYLDDPIMIAQRRERQRRGVIRHGPVERGKIQPIRKGFDIFKRCYVTNER